MSAAAGAAFADDTYPYVDHSKFVSTKTRAEVRAELAKARADGELAQRKEFVEHSHAVSPRAPEEVRNETTQAAKTNPAR
jgi:hypothetical protein